MLLLLDGRKRSAQPKENDSQARGEMQIRWMLTQEQDQEKNDSYAIKLRAARRKLRVLEVVLACIEIILIKCIILVA